MQLTEDREFLAKIFTDKGIDGENFFDHKENELKEIGIVKSGVRKNSYQQSTPLTIIGHQ